jgi:Fe-S-cluster containining protein
MKCIKCGQCCHQLSATFTIEDLNREPRLREVAVPIQKVGNVKLRAYMAEKGMPWAVNKPSKGAPCPFLGSDNLCNIHDTRPQICRDYPQESRCIKEMQELCLKGT